MLPDEQLRTGREQAAGGPPPYGEGEEIVPGAKQSTQREGPETKGRKQNGAQERSNLQQISANRPIFTLSVAADLLGLHPRTLRIYEEKQLVAPARTEGNRRRYSQNDINRFHSIRRLTSAGVNLEGVRVILDMADELTRLGGNPESIIERNLTFTNEAEQPD